MVEMFDVLECVRDTIEFTINKGTVSEQRERRKACERNVLYSLQAKFPDMAEHFNTSNNEFHCDYSDFAVTYKGEQLLRVGTGFDNFNPKRYKAKYDFGVPWESGILSHYHIEDIGSMPVEEMVKDMKEFRHILTRRAIIASILKKEQELKELREELHKENKILNLKDPVVIDIAKQNTEGKKR